MVIFLGVCALMTGLSVAGWFLGSEKPHPALPLVVGSKLGAPPAEHRRDSRIVLFAAGVARRFSPPSQIEKLDQAIQQAGHAEESDLERVLALKLAGSILFGIAGLMYFIAKPGIFGFVAVVLGVVGGYVVPAMSLTRRAESRREIVRATLPDAIDQLAVSVRAGLSVDSALLRVSQTLRGPFADELRRVVQDIHLGVSRSEALRAFSLRMDIPELSYFVRSLRQADSLGIPVSDTLMMQAKEMRGKRRQRAEEAAMKLPVKILAPTMACILPALMLVVLGPAILQLLENLKI
jgi:tight adherence protein C